LPLFGVGIVLFLYKAELIKEIELCLVIFCFVLHLWFFNSPVTSVIAAAAGFVIMFLFTYTNRVLSFFGKFSYSVYLIHPVLGATFVNVFSHNVSSGFAKFMLVSGGLVITAIGSYLMYLLVEKPSKKLSSKLSYKTK
jgi:peptidoglycan/LPS O-acetylase OafA/YrhL